MGKIELEAPDLIGRPFEILFNDPQTGQQYGGTGWVTYAEINTDMDSGIARYELQIKFNEGVEIKKLNFKEPIMRQFAEELHGKNLPKRRKQNNDADTGPFKRNKRTRNQKKS